MWLPKTILLQRPTLLTYNEEVLDLFQRPFPFVRDVVSDKNSPYKISYKLYDRPISLMDLPSERAKIPFINFELVVDGPQRERAFLNSTEGDLLRKHKVTRQQVTQWFVDLFDWLGERRFKMLELEVAGDKANHLDFYIESPMNFVEIYRKMIKDKNEVDFVRMERELPKR